uniref:Gustatory receptor n=1 Tax=Culicoides sonorensis TaxID=179676 RepID=A0A336MGF6_CULSO
MNIGHQQLENYIANKRNEVIDMNNDENDNNFNGTAVYYRKISVDIKMKRSHDMKSVRSCSGPKKRCQYFHEAMKWVIFVLQIFSLFPVSGFMSLDPNRINVNKPRFMIFINKLLFIMACCEFILMIKIYINQGVSFNDLSRISFYLSSLYAVYALHQLANSWKGFVLYWNSIEKDFLEKFYNEYNPNIKLKIIFVLVILMSFGIFDHVVFLMDLVADTNQTHFQCNITKYTTWEFLLHRFRPQYLILFNYHPVLLFVTEWIDVCLTCAWTLQDMFIIAISIVLTARFAQWNARVKRYELQVVPARIWFELREDFTKLTELVMKVDETMSMIILIASASNLYQICTNIFQSLAPRPDILDNVQFWFSLIFTISRTLLMLHFVAELNEKSFESRLTLRLIPSKGWCSEAQRLLDQMVTTEIALSGRKLFYITRHSILVIVASVLTYEIVLIDRIPKEPLNTIKCS